MKEVDGNAIDESGEHWTAECPQCGNILEFRGWFDCGDRVECKCGCIFTIKRVWINDKEYIE